MATFTVTVTRLRDVEPHPNADRLELAVVGDYRSVILKDQYKKGDLVAYVPEAAVLPDPVLEKLNMKGSSLLAGKAKNRVKAIRLRGSLSQGLCYPAEPDWEEGQDVADILGIVKYVPPIPAHLSGQVYPIGKEWVWNFDIENVKAWPDVLQEGEPVTFTEKIHGTWTGFGLIPDEGNDASFIVSSKGLFAQGLAFKDVPENDHNLYIRVARHLRVEEKLREIFLVHLISKAPLPIYVFGETFGMQDLKYGASTGQDEKIGFRVFAVYVGKPGQGSFFGDHLLEEFCRTTGLPRVPVLYRGAFSKEVMLQYTSGRETVSGQEMHIREGVVVTPVEERTDPLLGRVVLKSVSDKYLTRKGKKGREVTEYE